MVKKVLVITIFILLLVVYFLAELNRRPDFNQDENFNGISKDPCACYIFRKTLEENPSVKYLKTSNETFYEAIPKIKANRPTSFIVITNKFQIDSLNLSAVLKYVKAGNNFFISSYSFGQNIRDSLNFNNEFFNVRQIVKDNNESLSLVNPSLKCTKPVLFKDVEPAQFSKIDTARHIVLGTNKAGVNYIKVPYGKGAFYIHCQPLVFTNMHVLYSNAGYSYKALSYLKNTQLIWDDYYKPQAGRYSYESQTPFRFFLSQEPLRIALYLTFFLIAVYFLIESKRKQRFVPIVQPPVNTTVQFVSTIARLHQGQPDYINMAKKKFIYMKEMAFSRYAIRLDENDNRTAEQFSQKANIAAEKIKELFTIYRRINSSISSDAETLISFSALADEIYEEEQKR